MACETKINISDEDQDELSSSGAESDQSDANEDSNQSIDELSSSGAEGDQSDANKDSDQCIDGNDKSKVNTGWADAMKKILNTKKPKRKRTIVLSKAKKLNETKIKPIEIPVPFEIETKDGKIKKETIKVEEQSEIDNEQKKHRRKELGIRVKPSLLEREHERRLRNIATNGVVQLFNAVSQQRKIIKDKLKEAGPLERKREKALKNIDRREFLDVLMQGTNKIGDDNDAREELKEEEDESNNSKKKDDKIWSVLRDDFGMGAKLKDWNKHDASEDESSAPEEMDSD